MENVVIEINGVKHELVSGKVMSEDSCLDFCSLADYCLCLEDSGTLCGLFCKYTGEGRFEKVKE